MKIVHVIIAAAYKEGYGYQENILPAKHVELGLDTYVISSNKEYPLGMHYINEDRVKVIFLPRVTSIIQKIPLIRSFVKQTHGIYSKLAELSPDIIFIHGLQCFESLDVCKYCENHPQVKLYVDQHADYYNSPISRWRTRLYIKIVYGYIAKKLEKYTMKFWGVTPWRVDYLQKVYGVKPEHTDLLVMGGDEKLIDWENRTLVREQIRKKFEIPKDAFLVVSGGKIDEAKNIHLLLDAIKMMNDDVYFLLFGNMTKGMEEYCLPKIGKRIKYIGWVDSKQVYPLFLASDLAVFPGTHSVLWEQAMACGIPGLFKDWDGGFNHIDCGGNAKILKDISKESLNSEITRLIDEKEVYTKMKEIAETKGRKTFSYIEIAKKAIEFNYASIK